ncbi:MULTISPECIES: hypothetical protein [Saccharothrix]|uniref:hypothetical protein n=1 Tax=Saccharothrix TaxID=2071 RepID=UPI0018E9DB08|nr:hypothetical protein [Saccharothrix sp. CB00851]
MITHDTPASLKRTVAGVAADPSRGLKVGGPAAWTPAWSALFVAVFAPPAVTAYRRRA